MAIQSPGLHVIKAPITLSQVSRNWAKIKKKLKKTTPLIYMPKNSLSRSETKTGNHKYTYNENTSKVEQLISIKTVKVLQS